MLNNNIKILVAEDNAINQKLIGHILQRLGYEAGMASTGVKVLEALRSQRYDIVLMDVHMPEMDGIEASGIIQKEFDTDAKPVIIAVTANSSEQDRQWCLDAGMDDFISKPFKSEMIGEKLKYWADVIASRGM